MKELIEAINANTEQLKQVEWKMDRLMDALDSNNMALEQNGNAITQAEKNRRDYR